MTPEETGRWLDDVEARCKAEWLSTSDMRELIRLARRALAAEAQLQRARALVAGVYPPCFVSEVEALLKEAP